MKDKFRELLNEFNELALKNGRAFIINIIEEYCNRHNLCGPDCLAGLLEYIKIINERKKKDSSDNPLVKSFFETAYLFWALEKVGRKDLVDAVAKQMQSGWDFGETCGYKSNEANYFRSFEIELNVALRLLEHNLDIKSGDEGEPDYIINALDLVLEVKAPGSQKGLFQGIIKAVKQIERYGENGIIVVVLDHMVKRGMISNPEYGLDEDIIDIICSALPTGEKYSTIGVVAEWVDWNNPKCCSAIVQAIMLKSKQNINNEKLINLVLQAESNGNEPKIIFYNPQNHFPYDEYTLEDIDPSIDGKQFYETYLNG